MATKTASMTVTGTLTRCELRDEDEAASRYLPAGCQIRYKFLDCALTIDDGQTVYFCTPRSSYSIASVPGAAFVSYRVPADHPWFERCGENDTATPGKPADVTIVPRVQVGDRVTITGRIKAQKTSRAGKPYTVLNHVSRD